MGTPPVNSDAFWEDQDKKPETSTQYCKSDERSNEKPFKDVTKAVYLFLSVVIVNRRPNHPVLKAPIFHVHKCVLGRRNRHIDTLFGKRRPYLLRSLPFHRKGHDSAFFESEVPDCDTCESRQPLSQLCPEMKNSGPGRFKSPLKSVIYGCSKADFASAVAFPVLESASVFPYLVAVLFHPASRVQIQQRRFQSFQDFPLYEKEPGSAGSAQEFPAGCGKHITADALDIDRHLSDGLACVKQVQHTSLFGDISHLLCRIDETSVRGNVRQGN